MVNKIFLLWAACYLLLIKRSKILLLRRFNTGWEDGKYTLISGHLERGETVKEAMTREAKEEAGINLDPKNLHVVHVMHRKSNENLEYIDFFLTVDKWKGAPDIGEKDKCDDMRWFSTDNLPGNLLPHVRQAIECYHKRIYFSESSSNT